MAEVYKNKILLYLVNKKSLLKSARVPEPFKQMQKLAMAGINGIIKIILLYLWDNLWNKINILK